MLPTTFKDAVIDQIKLNSGPLSAHNEKNVISFYDFVVPAQVFDPNLSTMNCSTYETMLKFSQVLISEQVHLKISRASDCVLHNQ